MRKKATPTKLEQEARRLCTHTIVFTDLTEKMCAVRAMQGRTTKAIAHEFRITESEAQYRIIKAQKSMNTRFRRDYRNGDGKVAQKMLRATEQIGLRVVDHEIAPKFIPFARAGVPRMT
jgi:hypothetical protein